MRRISLIVILAISAAVAPTAAREALAAVPAKADTTTTASGKSRGNAVAPTDPVITIQGLCASHGKAAAQTRACTTVVSRRDFESFLKTLSATARGVEPSVYRKVAQNYFSLLVYSKSGQRTGVDKDPRFEWVLESTRLRALADMYRVQKMEQALHITDEEIEAYYKKNINGFEEVDLDRFQVPKNNPANLSDVEFRAKAKKLAEDLRARAVKGEDMAKLEKEVLEALGQKGLPAIEVGVRRGQLKEDVEKPIFALRQGEVTPVLDAAGLWIFFKRTSRETLPLQVVQSEIRGMLFEDKTAGPEKALHDAVHVDYNEAYFAAPPDTANSGQNSATSKPVAPGDAVITIHGLCGGQNPETGSCRQVITREQFDPFLRIALMNATNPSSAIPRSIAQGYVDDLIYADAAEKAGLDKGPRLPGVMELVRMRALSDMYQLKQDDKAHEISPQEIETYYRNNLAGFEELTLTHISVPRQKSATSHDTDFEAKAKRLADELHERATKGEDMEKLQKEVYQVLGLTNPFADYEARGIKTPPVSSLKPIRRGEIEQKTEAEVFALKPGQITSVREFPTAYVIYKLESRRTIPLEEATAEISKKLYQQNMVMLLKAFASVQVHYNERYFAPVAAVKHASASADTAAK